eukprot:scaffold1054_cov116-Isochrysis_galbana.AAC.10
MIPTIKKGRSRMNSYARIRLITVVRDASFTTIFTFSARVSAAVFGAPLSTPVVRFRSLDALSLHVCPCLFSITAAFRISRAARMALTSSSSSSSDGGMSSSFGSTRSKM